METKARKSNKTVLVTGIIILGIITAVILAVLVSLPGTQGRKGKIRIFDNIRYASDYDLEVGERGKSKDGSMTIWKSERDGVTYLRLWHAGKRESEIDYLDFLVYDSPSDARNVYDSIYEDYKQYNRDWDEGEDWFTSWEPGVCDASIVQMICIQDNVIITADIEIRSEWAEDDIDTVTVPVATADENVFDRRSLKEYVILNAPEICSHVLSLLR